MLVIGGIFLSSYSLPAYPQKFNELLIDRIDQLKKETPDNLYRILQWLTGRNHEPCVLDIFTAIIHEVTTGEKLSWWHWSKISKNEL